MAAAASDAPGRWCLVVPVKRLAVAKTRLAPTAGPLRLELALAFALDSVAAALRCPDVVAVVVVTDEPDAARVLSEAGALVVPDEPDDGLNPALVHGAAAAVAAHPGCAVGALSADLPALRPAELALALRAATDDVPRFVRDADGSGTTLLLARRPDTFAPAFGPGSAVAHQRLGARELTAADLGGTELASLRRDVDTADDLRAAVTLGLGPASARVVARLPAGLRRVGSGRVQATVRHFDPRERSGTVLLDDGVELPYDRAAFDAGGLRLLRVGQRVRIEVAGEVPARRVTFLTVATLADPR